MALRFLFLFSEQRLNVYGAFDTCPNGGFQGESFPLAGIRGKPLFLGFLLHGNAGEQMGGLIVPAHNGGFQGESFPLAGIRG